jgi:hypothetical protein
MVNLYVFAIVVCIVSGVGALFWRRLRGVAIVGCSLLVVLVGFPVWCRRPSFAPLAGHQAN